MNTDEHRRGGERRGRGRWLVAAGVFLALALIAACGHPEDCPEPCPRGMHCVYGACVPDHDVVDEGAEGADTGD